MSVVRTLVLGLAALTLYGCAGAAPSSARQYELEGQILAIRAEDREVLIKHGDIKGFMPGMTMPFKVRDSHLLEGKEPGDLVKATLVVEDTEAWLASLDKTGTAALADSAAMPSAAFVTPLRPGDSAPDTALTNQNGDPITIPVLTSDGAPLAVTFIYVRCPLPQFCPMLDRRFAEVQREIQSDGGLRGRARLLTVSFDPDADTPERLRAHAARLKADPAVWHFATAPPGVVDRFAARFGVSVIREQDGTITHNMRTTVLDGDGTVVSVYEGSDWTAAQVAEDMRRALRE
jgi:protein SCO1